MLDLRDEEWIGGCGERDVGVVRRERRFERAPSEDEDAAQEENDEEGS